MMRRSVALALFGAAALLVLGLAPSPALAAGDPSGHAAAVQYLRTHGYLPTTDPARLAQLKAQAAAQAAPAAGATAGPLTPVAGPSFQGQDENDLAPSDSTGAAGPTSFVEMINTRIAIYNRSGGLIASAPSEVLTGTAHGDLSDPQVMWDPATNRFYYVILNVNNDTFQFGFSKSSNPTTLPGSFCNYDADLGYGANLPDFPKLGDTTHSLLIGVNVFQGGVTFAGSDVDFITKPSGTGTITTCPARSTFLTGKVSNLKTTTGAQAATPNPAQQADGATTGWVAATPNALPAGALELFKVTERSNGTPVIPVKATSPPSTRPPRRRSGAAPSISTRSMAGCSTPSPPSTRLTTRPRCGPRTRSPAEPERSRAGTRSTWPAAASSSRAGPRAAACSCSIPRSRRTAPSPRRAPRSAATW
jgi:hypothetical protein